MVQPLPMCWKSLPRISEIFALNLERLGEVLLLLRQKSLPRISEIFAPNLERLGEVLLLLCMKPFGMKVIGMAPLRMELAKLRTAAELLERHTDLELLEPLGMEMAEMDECSKPWA